MIRKRYQEELDLNDPNQRSLLVITAGMPVVFPLEESLCARPPRNRSPDEAFHEVPSDPYDGRRGGEGVDHRSCGFQWYSFDDERCMPEARIQRGLGKDHADTRPDQWSRFGPMN